MKHNLARVNGPFQASCDNKQYTSDKILTSSGSEFGCLFASGLHKLTSPANSDKIHAEKLEREY